MKYIIGTVNPRIEGYEFIPIEELVGKQNLEKIKMILIKALILPNWKHLVITSYGTSPYKT